MTSSEGFQHHFKMCFFGCYIKKYVSFTLIYFAVLKSSDLSSQLTFILTSPKACANTITAVQCGISNVYLLSVVQLKGKHCQHPIPVMGVCSTCLPANWVTVSFVSRSRSELSQLSDEQEIV